MFVESVTKFYASGSKSKEKTAHSAPNKCICSLWSDLICLASALEEKCSGVPLFQLRFVNLGELSLFFPSVSSSLLWLCLLFVLITGRWETSFLTKMSVRRGRIWGQGTTVLSRLKVLTSKSLSQATDVTEYDLYVVQSGIWWLFYLCDHSSSLRCQSVVI